MRSGIFEKNTVWIDEIVPWETGTGSALIRASLFLFSLFREHTFSPLRRCRMKGYLTAMGYMGLVDGRYLLFCSESDYVEYLRESEEQVAEAA